MKGEGAKVHDIHLEENQIHSFGLTQASNNFHSSLPSSGFCKPNNKPSYHCRLIIFQSLDITHNIHKQNDLENLHGHIPIGQLVVEKQEYFQFDHLSSGQMLYPDHKPMIEKINQGVTFKIVL